MEEERTWEGTKLGTFQDCKFVLNQIEEELKRIQREQKEGEDQTPGGWQGQRNLQMLKRNPVQKWRNKTNRKNPQGAQRQTRMIRVTG